MNFNQTIWSNSQNLLNNNQEESALLYLYEQLNSELKNCNNCDSFLKYIMNKPLTSNLIVHIINALLPIKNELSTWTEFINYCEELLIKEIGNTETEILLKTLL